MSTTRPRSVDQAWADYRTANPTKNHPDGHLAFRAGYREGINTGALLTEETTTDDEREN
jgi:hypothetical protein